MSNIAYDLDGVFIPDCDRVPNLGGLDSFYELTMYMRPIFEPVGDYDIITARNYKYQITTQSWCNKHLTNQPKILYHDCMDETPSEYKARILNENPNIQLYIESEPSIVDDLSNTVTTGCRIVLFKHFIANGINL